MASLIKMQLLCHLCTKLRADLISVVTLGMIHASLVLPPDNHGYLIYCSKPDTLLETAYSSAQIHICCSYSYPLHYCRLWTLCRKVFLKA